MMNLQESKKKRIAGVQRSKKQLFAKHDARKLEGVLRCKNKMHEIRRYYLNKKERLLPGFGSPACFYPKRE